MVQVSRQIREKLKEIREEQRLIADKLPTIGQILEALRSVWLYLEQQEKSRQPMPYVVLFDLFDKIDQDIVEEVMRHAVQDREQRRLPPVEDSKQGDGGGSRKQHVGGSGKVKRSGKKGGRARVETNEG